MGNEYLSYLPPDECSSDRVGFIKRQDFLCGCPSATTTCALCSNHDSNDVEYAERHIPLLSLPLNVNPTCGEVIEFISVNDGDLSTEGCSALQEYQGYCGCPETPVKNECSFCPNGGTPSNPEKVVSDVFTCQGLYDFVSFLRADECIASSNDFKKIQAFAYVCGCPNTQPSCSLCSDGSEPPNPSKFIDDEGTTCGEYAELVASLTEDRCADQIDQIQATASTCGCGSAVSAPTERPGSSDIGSPPTINGDNESKLNSEGMKNPVNPQAIVISVAVIVPVILGLLVFIYYFITSKAKTEGSKVVVKPSEVENDDTPLPVERMEGSLSISDIPLESPTSSAPPSEAFSVVEEPPLEIDNENKIV